MRPCVSASFPSSLVLINETDKPCIRILHDPTIGSHRRSHTSLSLSLSLSPQVRDFFLYGTRRRGKPKKILGACDSLAFSWTDLYEFHRARRKAVSAARVEGKATGPQVPMFIVGYDTYHSVGVWPHGRKKRNVERSERRRERESEASNAWARTHEHVSRYFFNIYPLIGDRVTEGTKSEQRDLSHLTRIICSVYVYRFGLPAS